MRPKTFRFEPDVWLNNRTLRACSPAARGFWVDLLCLCYPTGYLPSLTDAQLARIIGESAKSIRGWLKELGEAGIFHVSEDDRLYSSRMVRESNFKAQAKEAGAKGGAIVRSAAQRKAKTAKPAERPVGYLETPAGQKDQAEAGIYHVAPAASKPAPVPAKPVGRAKPWWETPAGWARKGAEQAIMIKDGESIDEFKVRVSKKLGPGPHLDVLKPKDRKVLDKFIDDNTPKEQTK